ncbi:hypothetical protein CTA2_2051, partial [Colletotrichum tanaceti]
MTTLPEFMSSGIPSMAPGNTVYDMLSAQFASHIVSNENGYCTSSSRWSCPPSPTSSVDTSKADDSHDDAHSTTTTTSSTNSASASEDSSRFTEKGRRNNRYKNCNESVLS